MIRIFWAQTPLLFHSSNQTKKVLEKKLGCGNENVSIRLLQLIHVIISYCWLHHLASSEVWSFSADVSKFHSASRKAKYYHQVRQWRISQSNVFHFDAVFGKSVCQVIVWCPHHPPLGLAALWEFMNSLGTRAPSWSNCFSFSFSF